MLSLTFFISLVSQAVSLHICCPFSWIYLLNALLHFHKVDLVSRFITSSSEIVGFPWFFLISVMSQAVTLCPVCRPISWIPLLNVLLQFYIAGLTSRFIRPSSVLVIRLSLNLFISVVSQAVTLRRVVLSCVRILISSKRPPLYYGLSSFKSHYVFGELAFFGSFYIS